MALEDVCVFVFVSLFTNQDLPFQWDASLRAPARRGNIPISPWLRDEDGGKSRILRLNRNSLLIKENSIPLNSTVGFNSDNTKQDFESSRKGKLFRHTSISSKSRATVGFGFGHVVASTNMSAIHDSDMTIMDEEVPIPHTDGLKRSRSIVSSADRNISSAIHETSSSISTGLDQQARREP
ncbi:hypothetical protein V6N12_070698 [Hibiscus sabdariffa]|uniref:Uncharacterized protein n=1 Tax=Hibiscus sabdariffa TaxID=183260 RepID=A0ABR2FHL4_9ROSI